MDPRVKQLREKFTGQYLNLNAWFDQFDNMPYILVAVAHKSLTIRNSSCNAINFSDMPSCQAKGMRGHSNEEIYTFFHHLITTIGDDYVKSIILKYGPLAFIQENLPSELEVLLNNEIVKKSIENFLKATEIHESSGIIINKCSYSLVSDKQVKFGYHKSYQWWDDTGLRDL